MCRFSVISGWGACLARCCFLVVCCCSALPLFSQSFPSVEFRGDFVFPEGSEYADIRGLAMDEEFNLWFVSQDEVKVCKLSNPEVSRLGLVAFLESGNVLEEVATRADGIDAPVDLSFHPEASPPQLWVLNQTEATTSHPRKPEAGSDIAVSSSSAGSFFLVVDVLGGEKAKVYEKKIVEDAFSTHFMTNSAAFAFSRRPETGNYHGGYTFATAQADGDFRTGGGSSFHFMGLTLWSANLEIFGNTSRYTSDHPHDGEVHHVAGHQGGALGSHLDMLHESAYLQGVAWEDAHVFWAHQGFHESSAISRERHGGGYLLRYDFRKTHGPGGTYHKDGIIRRFRVELPENLDTPAHMEVDEEKRYLYLCSPKEGKLLAVDLATQEKVRDYQHPLERVEEYSLNDVAHEYVVEGLERPVGLALVGPYFVISDGDAIKLFRKTPVFDSVGRAGDDNLIVVGENLGEGLPWDDVVVVGSGPVTTTKKRTADGKERLVITGALPSQVVLEAGGRRVPDTAFVVRDFLAVQELPAFSVYPNPVGQMLYFSGLNGDADVRVAVYGLDGQQLMARRIAPGGSLEVGVLPRGTYLLSAFFAGRAHLVHFVRK